MKIGRPVLGIYKQRMDFAGQLEVVAQEQGARVPSRNEQLTLTIRSKYELLKARPLPKFNLARTYAPLNTQHHAELLAEFKALLLPIQEGEPVDVSRFMPLVLGALEGTSTKHEELRILIRRFGANIEKIQIEQILKGKLKTVNYGIDKKKDSNIREVSDKAALQSLGKLFDIKEIKTHRKTCNAIKSYLKSLKKFMEAIESSGPNEVFAEDSSQNIAYIEFANEEINFNKLKLSNQILGIDSSANIGEQKEEQPSENHVTPVKNEGTEGLQKDETASGKKNEDSENKMSEENKAEEMKENDQEMRQVRKRRTKQEMMKDLEAKQKEKQQKAAEHKKKEEEKLQKLQEKEKERLAKERQKELEKEAKEKEREAKEREREAKQKEKQAERVAKQAERQAKEAERKAKEAAKQAERLAKEKKNNPGQSLAKWFKPTEQSTPVKAEREEKIEEESVDALEEEKNAFMRSINTNAPSISELRSSFRTLRMKDETCVFQPYYVTIYIHKSRLEFDRFLINEERFKEYAQPHDENENGKYDDSSVEYEDFCGDFCDEKDEMSVEDEEASFNSAIVPDTYISEDELSSLNESKDQINVKINQGAEWSFAGSNNYTADRYTMFSCLDDDALPLPLSEPEQSNSELTLTLKCELYREIHGYYGAKDILIRRLASIADKVPKSYLDNLIRETTTKRGNQRLVKPEIIDFLNEQRENFAGELEEIKKRREEDNMVEMRGKMNEKEREIERLILEEAGTYYIIDLLHFLREKGYRMVKRDLIEFINARTGSEWDDVRRRMSKMQLKEKEKINNFLGKKDRKKEEKEEKDGKPREEDKKEEEKKDPSNSDGSDKNGEMEAES